MTRSHQKRKQNPATTCTSSHHQAVTLARMDREDSSSSEDDPSPIALNGLGSPNSRADTESLPSISSPTTPRPIVGRRGSRRNYYNEYCHQLLLQTSSESTMDELPTIPPEFIGGCVSEDSKFKYFLSDEDDQAVCEDSDLE